MKKLPAGIALLGAALLLGGAGCAAFQPQPEPVETPVNSAAANPAASSPSAVASPVASGLILSAEALGHNQVKFSWTAPEGLTEANRLIIVEGAEENPAHDGKHNWLRQYHANRAVIWSQRSAGKLHFRLCLTENNDKDTCAKYSNDVLVEVK